MYELAIEVVDTPANVNLNLSSVWLIQDVMIRSHETAASAANMSMILPHLNKISATADAMNNIYAALDETLNLHTRLTPAIEILELIDYIAALFQTEFPAILSGMLNDQITVDQFKGYTTPESLQREFLKLCSAKGCIAEAELTRVVGLLDEQRAPQATAPEAVPDPAPNSSPGKNRGMEVGFAVLGMMLFLLFGLCAGAVGVWFFFIKRPSESDDDQWRTQDHVGVNIPSDKGTPSPSSGSKSKSKYRNAYTNEAYDETTQQINKKASVETQREPMSSPPPPQSDRSHYKSAPSSMLPEDEAESD